MMPWCGSALCASSPAPVCGTCPGRTIPMAGTYSTMLRCDHFKRLSTHSIADPWRERYLKCYVLRLSMWRTLTMSRALSPPWQSAPP